MSQFRNFTPYASVSAAPTGASAVTNFPTPAQLPLPSSGSDLLLQNVGTVLVYFKVVTAAGGTADANSIALQPGAAMVFGVWNDSFAQWQDGTGRPPTGVALFTPAGTGNINIVVGVGC